jgi:pyridoxal phosphate enzyme (YggS family)
MTDSITERFLRVQETVAYHSGRREWQRGKTRLIVVTKRQSLEACMEVKEAGAACFGENYPEEAVEKFTNTDCQNIEFHMIGHLQSRKIKLLSPLFSVLQTIDRIEIAEKVDNYFKGLGKRIDALVEIDLTGEQAKSGFLLNSDAGIENFYASFEKILEFRNINLVGVMTMGYFPRTEETNRSIFSRARYVLGELQSKYRLENFTELSMGTSGDYITAIQEGATMVRVGELIMGARRV